MRNSRLVTVSARVSVRTHRLAEAVAELRGTTLSSFVAEAVEHAALRELSSAATKSEPGVAVAPQHTEVIYGNKKAVDPNANPDRRLV